MDTRIKIVIAAAAGAIVLGGTTGAIADGRGRDDDGRGRAMFEMLDTDQDGKITRAEAEAFRDQKFAEFDADASGELDLGEYTAMVNSMMADRMKRRFERRDEDGNGSLSKTEVGGRLARMFEHLDDNGDGVIELSEMRDHRRYGDGDHGYRHRRHHD